LSALVLPPLSLRKVFAHPHTVENSANLDLRSVGSLVDDLLSLKRIVTLKKLIKWEPSRTDLYSLAVFVRWTSKDVHQDGIGLQMAQVEIVHGIFEAEQSVVYWCI